MIFRLLEMLSDGLPGNEELPRVPSGDGLIYEVLEGGPRASPAPHLCPQAHPVGMENSGGATPASSETTPPVLRVSPRRGTRAFSFFLFRGEKIKFS